MSAPPRKPAQARKPAAPRKPAQARKPAAPRKPAQARKPAAPRKPAARRKAPAPPRRPRRSGPPVDRRILERRRRVREEAARRRRRVTMSVLALGLVLGGAYGVSRSPLFAVGEVRIAGVPAEQAAQVRKIAGVGTGGNVLDVDTAAVTGRVEELAWVKDARVRRLPGAIEIRVVPRVAVAVIRLPGAAWMIDGEGWVMGGGAPEGLALVEAPDAVLPPVGERVADAGIRNALAVHAALPESLRAMVERYHAPSARGLRLRLVPPAPAQDAAAGPGAADPGAEAPSDEERPGVWVRFGLAERAEAKGRVIELLLAQAREQAAQAGRPVAEGQLPPGIAELDVRAPDNPVLIPSGADA